MLRTRFAGTLLRAVITSAILCWGIYASAGPIDFPALEDPWHPPLTPQAPDPNEVKPSKAISTIPQIAIIIDDIGYNRPQGEAAIDLPGAITYAVIPHSPNAKRLAVQAWQQGKEVMLHMPMSSLSDRKLDSGGLTEYMEQQTFTNTLSEALAAIPHVSGVNNHMGSLLTQQAEPMQWLMAALKEHKLYFIDSRTSADSIAWETAKDFNVPTLKRDVFLDNQRNAQAIDVQFEKLIAIAKRKGYAVAIGHPYPETIEYLKTKLPTLAQQGINIAPASHLIAKHRSRLELARENVTQVTKNQ